VNISNLNYCGDKGISVGEKSYIELNKLFVYNSAIGIASKDSSISYITDAYFENVNKCMSAYNKKQEFLGGILDLKKIECKNFLAKLDKDNLSKIIIKEGKFN